jgi:hypothetical protein
MMRGAAGDAFSSSALSAVLGPSTGVSGHASRIHIDRGWHAFDLIDGRVTNLSLRFTDIRTWRALWAVFLDLLTFDQLTTPREPSLDSPPPDGGSLVADTVHAGTALSGRQPATSH